MKEIEKRDSVLTPKQQIERLLRPGSTYFNLNPFEVLQVEPETPLDEVKKKYRRFSILVHPDKNQDDAERAQQAFEIINRAWKTLESDETRQKCMDIIEEAKGRTDLMVSHFTIVFLYNVDFIVSFYSWARNGKRRKRRVKMIYLKMIQSSINTQFMC